MTAQSCWCLRLARAGRHWRREEHRRAIIRQLAVRPPPGERAALLGDAVRRRNLWRLLGAVAGRLVPLLASGLVSQWGLRAPLLAAAGCWALASGVFSRLHAEPAARMDQPTAAPVNGYRAVLELPGIRLLLVLQLATFFTL